ncbi:hydrolase [Rathayibacter sp. CAU 1779]
MTQLSTEDLDRRLTAPGGWPAWATMAPYRHAAHPQAADAPPLALGANCQRYAYAVLALFDRHVAPHRSSELWEDPTFPHRDRDEAQDLDLVLFSDSNAAWGAHVAVIIGDELLHLCAEEGRPAIWSWEDFAARSRYEHIVGVVTVPPVAEW